MGERAEENFHHKCRECGRQFVEDPQWKPKDKDTIALVKLLLLEKISLAGIVRAVGVSASWLQNYVNKYYQQVEQQAAEVVPKEKGKLTVQMDELWSFVDNKGNKQWVWLAIDARTREIIGCEIGDGCISLLRICKKRVKMKKLVKSSNKDEAKKMTPSDQQQLKAHLKAAAEILYRNTDPIELKSFESREKSVRQKMLSEVGPELGSFFFSSIRNSNRKTAKNKINSRLPRHYRQSGEIFWLESL